MDEAHDISFCGRSQESELPKVRNELGSQRADVDGHRDGRIGSKQYRL